MNANPTTPKRRQIALRQRGYCEEKYEYGTKTASATARIAAEAISQPRCVSSMRMRGSAPHFPPSNGAKNVRGSTRCAASCGHAYTQLGSFKCVQRSHDVAFCFTIALLRPGRSGSSATTSKGCRLMLPYGQLRAQSPQPMHQSSMITSRELRRRMEPTGQPTMQSGSRHWRHDVATRYCSKRKPSRINRLTPPWASAQAFTQS